jgi:diphthamide synthase (EF-2-diphthine--ammonia ligase)
MKIIFPIWGRDTRELAATFLDRGYRAVVASVDTTYLHASFAGRAYDRSFLEDLPEEVDPCGENGEFHTFVTAGPGVQEAIRVEVTGRKTDGRMCYARLQPSL